MYYSLKLQTAYRFSLFSHTIFHVYSYIYNKRKLALDFLVIEKKLQLKNFCLYFFLYLQNYKSIFLLFIFIYKSHVVFIIDYIFPNKMEQFFNQSHHIFGLIRYLKIKPKFRIYSLKTSSIIIIIIFLY